MYFLDMTLKRHCLKTKAQQLPYNEFKNNCNQTKIPKWKKIKIKHQKQQLESLLRIYALVKMKTDIKYVINYIKYYSKVQQYITCLLLLFYQKLQDLIDSQSVNLSSYRSSNSLDIINVDDYVEHFPYAPNLLQQFQGHCLVQIPDGKNHQDGFLSNFRVHERTVPSSTKQKTKNFFTNIGTYITKFMETKCNPEQLKLFYTIFGNRKSYKSMAKFSKLFGSELQPLCVAFFSKDVLKEFMMSNMSGKAYLIKYLGVLRQCAIKGEMAILKCKIK